MGLSIDRLPAVLAETGNTRSPHYDRVARGLFTKPIKLGRRAAGWPSHEVEALVAASVAGLDEISIRALVEQLHASRPRLLAQQLEKLGLADPTKPGV
ncbi:MAG: AlpA family phage regulatory protein [Paucibacter sp.]|nr:AlpA family phage regulatory protein [Roseateles sp.]